MLCRSSLEASTAQPEIDHVEGPRRRGVCILADSRWIAPANRWCCGYQRYRSQTHDGGRTIRNAVRFCRRRYGCGDCSGVRITKASSIRCGGQAPRLSFDRAERRDLAAQKSRSHPGGKRLLGYLPSALPKRFSPIDSVTAGWRLYGLEQDVAFFAKGQFYHAFGREVGGRQHHLLV